MRDLLGIPIWLSGLFIGWGVRQIYKPAYISRQLAALEQKYGFTPGMNIDDEDTNAWGDAKQRAYGRYAGLLSVRDNL